MADSRLDLIAELQDNASKKLDALSKKMQGFSKETDRASGSSEKLNDFFARGVQASQKFAVGLVAVGAGLAGVVGIGVKVAADLETARQGFITLLGSAEKADKTMTEIKIAAAKTPFELVGLTQATQLLASVTKDGSKAVKVVLDVGEALAAMGKGQAELDRIIVNLQQIAAVGKASTLDVKQFAFAGIPIFEMLQQETGKAGEALGDFITDGGVTFELLTKMFDKANNAGGRFFNAYINQSGTFNQLLSNTKDIVGIFLSDVAKQTGVFDLLKEGMSRFVTYLTENQSKIIETIQLIISTIKENLPLVTAIIAGALTPAIISATVAFSGFLVAIAPYVAAAASIVLATKALKVAWDNDFLGMKTTITWFGDQVEKTLGEVKNTINLYLPQMKELWKAHGADVKSAIKGAWDFIASYTVGILKSLLAPVKNMLDGMLSTVRIGMKVLQGNWSGAWEEARALVGRMLVRVVDAIKGMISPFIEAGKSLIDAILKKFQEMFPEMYEAGKNIVLGLINGIKGMAGDAAKAAGDVANGAIQSVKDFLLIKSPSKVMAQIGEFTMEGFIIGMHSKKEAVRQKSKELAKQLTDALAEMNESYKESGTKIAENLLDLNDKHSSAMQKFREEIKKTKDEITSLEKGYTSFITGEANKFGDVFVGQEEKVATLKRELSAARLQGEDSGKLTTLQGQLENEQRILAEARSFYLQSESDVKNKVQELEANLQYTVNQLRSATSVEDQARLQVRSENLQTQIDYMKEREATFAGEQKTLAEGVERSRAMARMTEMEKYIFTMQQRRVEAKKEYDEKLAQKQQELKDAQDLMIKEVDVFVIRMREINKINTIIETQHKEMMERQTKVTLEEVNKQIEAYKRLAEASKNAVGGRISSFSTGGVVERFATGGMASGTDTVPAMLTPGEVILNAAQQKNLASQIRGGNGSSLTIYIDRMIGDDEYAEKLGSTILKQLQLSTAF